MFIADFTFDELEGDDTVTLPSGLT